LIVYIDNLNSVAVYGEALCYTFDKLCVGKNRELRF